MERNSFVFYDSFYKAVSKLKSEDQAQCLKALCDYCFNNQLPDNSNPVVAMFFELIKPQVDKNNQRYENGCKGGRPKTKQEPKQNQIETKQKPKQQNSKPNDNDNDNVNDNDIKEKEIKKEKENQAETAPLALPQTKQILKPKTLNRQQLLYEYFSGKYKANTGLEYLPAKKDFVILAELLKTYTPEQIRQKIDWLETGCLHSGIFWFANDINDFTIGTLKSQWNHILPKLTEEQKKQQAEAAEREKHKADLRRRGIQC